MESDLSSLVFEIEAMQKITKEFYEFPEGGQRGRGGGDGKESWMVGSRLATPAMP